MRDVETLDQLPLHQLTPEEFSSYAIVLGVNKDPDPAAPRRLFVPAHQLDAMQDLRKEIGRVFGRKAGDVANAEDRILLGLMAVDLKDDAMCNRLPGGRPIIIARSDVAERFGARALAERMHQIEIEAASTRGEDVPAAVAAYYRGGSTLNNVQAHA